MTVLEPPMVAAPEQFPLRLVYGEISGQMVSVARWRGQPALQIAHATYGLIWCVLSDTLVRQFGGEQTIADVWSGRVVSVPGRIYYGQSGKPTRIEASDVRAKEIPEIDIQDVLDPDFTSGLSPVEYLQRLHEGNLG